MLLTELVVACSNRPLLLEKVCCALASQEITIISADVFTRKDGIVCDIFRVSTLDWEAIQSKTKKQRVLETFTALFHKDEYHPEKYLKKKKNYTTINVQGLDRIGLLHDLFLEIGKLGLATVNARICTEKGAALNTIYVSYPGGGKIEDPEKKL